jgi:hypothetical protein
MGWTIDVLWFDSRRGLGIFLFTTASTTALELTQPPIQWVPGALSLGVKRPGREADHSPPSSAEVKECVELYLTFPRTLSWSGDQFKKAQGLLYFTLLYLNLLTITFSPLNTWPTVQGETRMQTNEVALIDIGGSQFIHW